VQTSNQKEIKFLSNRKSCNPEKAGFLGEQGLQCLDPQAVHIKYSQLTGHLEEYTVTGQTQHRREDQAYL
jgi:hypothetical protein